MDIIPNNDTRCIRLIYSDATSVTHHQKMIVDQCSRCMHGVKRNYKENDCSSGSSNNCKIIFINYFEIQICENMSSKKRNLVYNFVLLQISTVRLNCNS
jgi:hypothetical protein